MGESKTMGLKSIRQRCPTCGFDKRNVYIQPPGTRCPIHGTYLIAESAVSSDNPDPQLGRVISDSYLIFDRIGQGGMGSVYKAVHIKLSRIVALKLINTEGVDPSEVDMLTGRFEFEAKSLSSVAHRNIVTVFDYGESDGDYYLVLEYVHGRTVADLIESERTVPFKQSLELIYQLLDALSEVHARGIVHRDVKPSNLMLDDRDESTRLVLIDFGVAKGKNLMTGDFRRELTRTGMAVGTPRYMSPEVLQGDALGPWSDLYAVGVVLYQMIAGVPPFRGSSADVITAHLRDPVPLLPPELNLPELNLVVKTGMAKKPEDRFESAEAFKTALLQAEHSFMGRHERIETQILAPLPNEKQPISPQIKEERRVQSTDSLSLSQSESAFNSAITEPHRMEKLAEIFRPPEVEIERKVSNSNWRLLLAFGFLLILLFALLPLLEVNKTEPTPAASRDASVVETSAATEKKGALSDVTRPLVRPVSGTVTPGSVDAQSKASVSKAKTSKSSQATSKSRQRRSGVRLTAPTKKKKVSARKKYRSRGVQKSPVKTSKPPVESPDASVTSDGNSAPIPVRQPTVADLVEKINIQIDSCDCERSKITISRLEVLSKARAQALGARWAEACGVMGEGCRR